MRFDPVRSASSCAIRAARIAAASASHRRVDPSISVNRNVTTPEGAAAADTRTGCHTEPRRNSNITGLPRPQSSGSAVESTDESAKAAPTLVNQAYGSSSCLLRIL
jgi:hypothetical protein